MLMVSLRLCAKRFSLMAHRLTDGVANGSTHRFGLLGDRLYRKEVALNTRALLSRGWAERRQGSN